MSRKIAGIFEEVLNSVRNFVDVGEEVLRSVTKIASIIEVLRSFTEIAGISEK